ncbi:MAG: class I SAM-dependent methyltransferase [Actinobacteria bacterium]|nr:class I SAM-dependent methyltransferase [Actinomycetota bacterium]
MGPGVTHPCEGATPNGYRVVHGESDQLPGLVVDRYAHVAVVKLYSAAWVPHLAQVVPALAALLPVSSIVLRLARSLSDADLHGLHEGMSLHGPDVDRPIEFLEHGLAFEADVIHGQKTGWFLDQRDNRALVGSMSAGARVLDVFCCGGGFSVHAAAGGARSALAIDSSPFATAAAERNMQRNAHQPSVAVCRFDTVTGEAFAELERLGGSRGRFDVVVVDPPSFARAAVDVPRAVAAYERLAALAVVLVERGGMLVQASCSARVDEATFVRAVHGGAARAGFDLDEVRRTGHAVDHPIGFPEGGYLKAVFARPRRSPR